MSVIASGAARFESRTRQLLLDYLSLTKPRVIVLLEITAFFAMIIAARGVPSPVVLMATLVGGALSAGGANAINCWFDRDIDAQMARTRNRPLPDGRIAPAHALWFGGGLGAIAFAELAVFTNLLAATLALVALLFYVLVYTMWLKRTSVNNIVIGGAAGAIPPLVGWAAVTNQLSLTAFFLFAVIFYWTPPHFWALALLIQSDYAHARVPMMPVVMGGRATRYQIVLYSVIMSVVTLLPFLARSFGGLYLAGAVILDAVFIWHAIAVSRRRTQRAARRLFYYSLIYLAALFAVMAVDRVATG